MERVGSFILERELGRGATAQVFLAHRAEAPSEKVALKIFHPGLWDREDLRKRALAEFRTASVLNHPNIVRVLEPCWETDKPAVALEYVDGSSLEEFQKRLPYILPEVAVLILIEVLSALEHAHAQGVIHRDLKPANILISKSGRVLVSDFGLAKMADVSRLTLSGTILGSPDFMSPEQARGDVTSLRSDLFSAAAILYFLITGTRPFARHSPLATLAAVNEANAEPVQRRNPKISAALARTLHRALQADPLSRPASAAEMRAEFQDYLSGLGLARETFNFADWVSSPTETLMGAMKICAESLSIRCEALIRSEQSDTFLETLAHLSLVAPESGALPRLMSEFETRQRQRRHKKFLIPGVALGVISACAVVLGGWWFVHDTGPGVDAIPSTQSALKPVSHPPRIVASKAKAAPAVGSVRFDVPDDIRVFWNGKKVNPKKSLKDQSLGKHWIRLEKSGNRPIVREVLVRAGEPTVIRVR